MKANIELTTDPRFKQSFNGVIDHRNSNVQLTTEELSAIAESVSNNDLTVGKWVILVGNPENTAFSLLYAYNIKHQHPQSICSTVKGASDFLSINLTEILDSSSVDY